MSHLRGISLKVIFFCLTLLMLSGTANSAESRNVAEKESDTLHVRGVVLANDRAALSANLNERVIRLPYKEGEAFEKGEELVAFDCFVAKAEYQAARADYQIAKSRHDNQVELLTYKATGELDVKLSKAELKKTAALQKAAQGKLKDCSIKAPFAGKVVVLNTRLYETPAQDEILIEIVGTESLELQLVVPSRWLAWLEAGLTFPFHVDELNIKANATVSRISAEVDAVSSTVKVFATLDKETADVLPGMSGRAYLSAAEKNTTH